MHQASRRSQQDLPVRRSRETGRRLANRSEVKRADALRRHRRLSAALFLAGACACASLAGCSKADPYAATERAIRRSLPGRLGPARSYSVRIARSETNLVGGKIGWIEIEGREVQAASNLIVDELRVRLDDVRFDRGDRTITDVGSSAVSARISAEAATRYVVRRGPQYEGVRFEFHANEAVVHATPALLGIRLPVKVSGRPLLRGEHEIDFDTSHLALGILPLPSPLLSLLERRINPILDLKTFDLPVILKDVHIEPGYAVVQGTVRFPSRP
jgi:hypothetical protein